MDLVTSKIADVEAGGVASPPDLHGFFAPGSVALVGATEDTGRFGGKVLDRLRRFGFDGPIYPVNPSLTQVQGFTCYPSLKELPEVVEHVGIAVPTRLVFDVLEDCAATGVRYATIFSAGFAEGGDAEGRERQKRLKTFAERTGIRIMGPNCNGFVNFVEGLAFTSSGTVIAGRYPAGNIGLVSQSGGAAQVNVMWRALQLGLRLSRQVSCGNCADLDVLDFLSYMIDDEHTDVIMMIVEDLGRGRDLFDVAARAAERKKPVIALKLGRTEVGSRAASSHTGAITGSDAVHDAVFRQCGIIRVNDCNELYETAMLFRGRRIPNGRRAAALSISGGNAAIVADLGAHLGIEWPDYSEQTQACLSAVLPTHGRATNPSDVTSAVVGKPEVLEKAIGIIAADPGVDFVIPILTFAQRSDIDQAVAAAEGTEKPLALLWTGGCGNDPALTAPDLVEGGLSVYRDALSCLRSVRDAMRYGEFLRDRPGQGQRARRPDGADVGLARSLLTCGEAVLNERRSKQVLAAYGFPVTAEMAAKTADEAVAAFRRIGCPVALKVESRQILHKTESGAIRLNLREADEVRGAFQEVVAAARSYAPEVEIDGVLVQEMAPAGALEIILGISPDPTFGSAIMVGLGGVHVEILRDVAFRVPPVSVTEALSMLRELRAYRILEGVRGKPPFDIPILCGLISRLSWLALDMADGIRELDMNPVFVYPAGGGARIVDALITTNARADGK